jgi:hypothetical protein
MEMQQLRYVMTVAKREAANADTLLRGAATEFLKSVAERSGVKSAARLR